MSMGGCLLLLRFAMKRVFDQGSQLVLSSYMCVDFGSQACSGGWRGEPSISSIVPPGVGQGARREAMSHSRAGR